jgi:hypothetical protein
MLVQVRESIVEVTIVAQITGESRRDALASMPLQEKSEIEKKPTREVREASTMAIMLLAS